MMHPAAPHPTPLRPHLGLLCPHLGLLCPLLRVQRPASQQLRPALRHLYPSLWQLRLQIFSWVALCALQGACATLHPGPSPTLQAGAQATDRTGPEVPAPGSADRPLAQLRDPNGTIQSIDADDLHSGTAARLRRLDDDHAQRRLAVLWAGVEEAVAQRLLQGEAQRRSLSVATLLAQEVEAKISAPSDDEMRSLYETHRTLIPVPFSAARPLLKAQWRADRSSQLRRALIDRLRSSHSVRLNLPLPRLSRQHLELGPGPRRGPTTAAVTVVAFGDYECPYSAQARRLLQRLEELYPQDVQIVYRDYVLPQHSRGRAAAQAAHCAGEQQHFWPYYNLLFEHPFALGDSDLREHAKRAELNLPTFEACMASDRPAQALQRATDTARSAQVQGTPALFVNGMQLRGVLPVALLQALVDRELHRS
jgi:hypothetical protein